MVGHTTKHMTDGSSWDMEIGLPSVEDVTLGLRPRVTCSTSGRIFTFHTSCRTNYHITPRLLANGSAAAIHSLSGYQAVTQGQAHGLPA